MSPINVVSNTDGNPGMIFVHNIPWGKIRRTIESLVGRNLNSPGIDLNIQKRRTREMGKNLITSLFGILLICNLNACSDGGGSNSNSTNTKYLAENIVFDSDNTTGSIAKLSKEVNPFNFNLIRRAYAQSDNIDTETEIMAENVIFENSYNSQIKSDNVQDALEEITLILSEVMVGTWEIQNLNNESVHEPTGKIDIYDDGTFDLIEGSFVAIGMGSGTGGMGGFCDHTEENQTYQIYIDELVGFTHFNNTTENSVIPLLIKLREDEIVFMGGGGCGSVSRWRVSILSRVIE